MGSYHGNHLKIKLKESARPRFKEVLDCLFSGDERSQTLVEMFPELSLLIGKPTTNAWEVIDEPAIDYLDMTVVGQSTSFNIYNSRRIEGLVYEAFSSCKYNSIDVWLALLNAYKQELDLVDGQVVYRSLFEQLGDGGMTEEVIWWDALNGVFRIDQGWEYGDEFDDPNHPCYHEWGKDDSPFTSEELFIPPMNIMEICAQQGRGFTRIIPDRPLLESKQE